MTKPEFLKLPSPDENNPCRGCVGSGQTHNGPSCASLNEKYGRCWDEHGELIYVKNTPESVAAHIAMRLTR